jgi:hypothetical protein
MLRPSRYNATDGCDHCEEHVVKIVCIAWGAQISEPGPLKPASEWQQDGPALPPEFVRNSDDSAELALVLHAPTRLEGETHAKAEEYVRRIPAEIRTLYRGLIEDRLGWMPMT